MILAQPPKERVLLMRHRESLIRQFALVTENANLRRRLDLAEDRLRPKLVEE